MALSVGLQTEMGRVTLVVDRRNEDTDEMANPARRCGAVSDGTSRIWRSSCARAGQLRDSGVRIRYGRTRPYHGGIAQQLHDRWVQNGGGWRPPYESRAARDGRDYPRY